MLLASLVIGAGLLAAGVTEMLDEWLLAAAIIAGGLGILALFMLGASSPSVRRAAPILLLALAIFATDSTFRFRAYVDKSIDTQIVVKVVLWGVAVAYAALHFVREKRFPLSATGWWWLAFLLWNVATALEAPNPLFSLVAASSLVVFFAVEFALLDHRGEDALAWAIILGTA
ncbi:MAG: hypothetical protein JO294_04285, partial [Alphaproteobacteria bacterium]|nr:hypothetical protein [Alphaproteobacteria bacterium]